MRHVNPHEASSELAAVWYAANYYYKVSFTRRVEYVGWVFKRANGSYGITVREGLGFDSAEARVEDVPQYLGAIPTAIWHTHLPFDALARDGDLKVIARGIDDLASEFGMGWRNFSGKDIKLSRAWTEVALKKIGRKISIYLVTDTLIKRFTPDGNPQIKSWPKKAPSHFKESPY